MAPVGFLDWLRAYHTAEEETIPPPISTSSATGLLIFYTFLYVAPFYISSSTRPSSTLSRDAPSVIQGRIGAVTFSCIVCSVFTFVILASTTPKDPLGALHKMGYFPIGFADAAKCLGLTCILFLGPLFEAAIAEGSWRDWLRLRGVGAILGSWTGYRNFVAGPITEEVLFRSAAVPLFLLSRASKSTIIFGTPIIFGLAHIHHFYEFRITHPNTPVGAAVTRSIFQLGYTTLFGSYTTFLYLRTGSLLTVIFVHSFCNWMGLPRFWGKVGAVEPLLGSSNRIEQSRKRDKHEDAPTVVQIAEGRLSIWWTVAYYVLLLLGAFGFWKEIWTLTESSSALSKFGAAKI